jgi:pre-60S factor REI1
LVLDATTSFFNSIHSAMTDVVVGGAAADDASVTVTCISCRLMFSTGKSIDFTFFFFFFFFSVSFFLLNRPDTAAAQREHYRSDLHRYNLKRRVAQLPCVTQAEYESRVAAKQAQAAPATPVAHNCAPCRKSFKSASMLDSHIRSKKHLLRLKDPLPDASSSTTTADAPSVLISLPISADGQQQQQQQQQSTISMAQLKSIDLSTLSEEQLLDLKIQTGVKLEPTDCLFCSDAPKFASPDLCIEHMAAAHSFYIPDLPFITDIAAFLQFLGQKIGIGNACVNCSKSFLSLDAVRAHMLATSHSKLPLGAEASEELAEFYDFSGLAAGADAAADEPGRALVLPGDVVPQRRVVDADAYFVHFDDGRVVGHRTLVTFFKQNVLKANPNEAALLRAKVATAYRQLTDGRMTMPQLDKSTRIAHFAEHTRRDKNNIQVAVKKNGLFIATGNARHYC